MSSYALALLSLAVALAVQCITTGMVTLGALQPPYRRGAMVLAIGLGLLALHHAFTLELALHTGIFDLRQDLLAAGVSVLLFFGLLGLRPRKWEKPPPR